MSPNLLERLFSNIKQVIARPIALADRRGVIYQDQSDFKKISHFEIEQPVKADAHFLNIETEPDLRAIPIFIEGKFYVLIVLQMEDEDLQTIQIINSLSELIIQQFVTEHKPQPDAVDLLLTRVAFKGQTIDVDEFAQQMAALGYRLDIQRSAIAIELKGFWENYLQTAGTPLGEKEDLIAAKKRDIEKSLNSFFSKNQDNLIGYLGNDLFLVLKDLQDSDYTRFCNLLGKQFSQITGPLKNIHIKEVTIGVGSNAFTAGEMMESIAQSIQILRLGKKVLGVNQVHRFGDLGVLPMVMNSSDSQKLNRAQELFNLLDDRELVETLEAFFLANLNLTQTSEKLGIHRNTVIYRLDKISEILGKDPRKFEEAVELYLANLFLKVLN